MMTHRRVAAAPVTAYEPWRQRAFDAISAFEMKGPAGELVAERVRRIAASPRPRLRYVVGQQAKVVTGLCWFAPAGVVEGGVRRTFRPDG